MQMETKGKLGQLYLCQTKDFIIKTVIREKEGHYRMIQRSVQQEDISFVNIYAHKYIKQILPDLNVQIGSNTIMVRYLSTTLSSMNRLSRQKIINKEKSALNDMLDQMNLTDTYKTFYTKATKYTFFTSACETFPKIDHTLGYKTSQYT